MKFSTFVLFLIMFTTVSAWEPTAALGDLTVGDLLNDGRSAFGHINRDLFRSMAGNVNPRLVVSRASTKVIALLRLVAEMSKGLFLSLPSTPVQPPSNSTTNLVATNFTSLANNSTSFFTANTTSTAFDFAGYNEKSGEHSNQGQSNLHDFQGHPYQYIATAIWLYFNVWIVVSLANWLLGYKPLTAWNRFTADLIRMVAPPDPALRDALKLRDLSPRSSFLDDINTNCDLQCTDWQEFDYLALYTASQKSVHDVPDDPDPLLTDVPVKMDIHPASASSPPGSPILSPQDSLEDSDVSLPDLPDVPDFSLEIQPNAASSPPASPETSFYDAQEEFSHTTDSDIQPNAASSPPASPETSFYDAQEEFSHMTDSEIQPNAASSPPESPETSFYDAQEEFSHMTDSDNQDQPPPIEGNILENLGEAAFDSSDVELPAELPADANIPAQEVSSVNEEAPSSQNNSHALSDSIADSISSSSVYTEDSHAELAPVDDEPAPIQAPGSEVSLFGNAPQALDSRDASEDTSASAVELNERALPMQDNADIAHDSSDATSHNISSSSFYPEESLAEPVLEDDAHAPVQAAWDPTVSLHNAHVTPVPPRLMAKCHIQKLIRDAFPNVAKIEELLSQRRNRKPRARVLYRLRDTLKSEHDIDIINFMCFYSSCKQHVEDIADIFDGEEKMNTEHCQDLRYLLHTLRLETANFGQGIINHFRVDLSTFFSHYHERIWLFATENFLNKEHLIDAEMSTDCEKIISLIRELRRLCDDEAPTMQ